MVSQFTASIACAKQLDEEDALSSFKQRFYFPQKNSKDVIYFCGNSLGLQPRNVKQAFQDELDNWRELAIDGYFKGPHPWLNFADETNCVLAKIMGAQQHEITIMNTLTVNLHLMLFSFYKPTSGRYKIIMEAGAFPSDQYAVASHIKNHGLQLSDALIEVAPRDGEKLLREEDILLAIDQHKNQLALVLFGGIHYYTGQLLDIKLITEAAHKAGAVAGWDLAHVAGNVPVFLHDWNVDFAVWCSYKYLNAGPGAVGSVFIHEKHAQNTSINRMAGWWGNDERTRFNMEKEFHPKPGAGGWNVSTVQVFNQVALNASMKIFGETDMTQLRDKSIQLTAYLEYLLNRLTHIDFKIITPAAPEKRGAQLCLFFEKNGKEVFDKMLAAGIVVDYRNPGVIRVAPAPLYCSYEDVYRFYECMKSIQMKLMTKHHYSFLALGDSYTVGESVPLHESFPYQTIQILRKAGYTFQAPEIIAQTGWTSFELAEHLLHTRLNEYYDFISLLIGVNNQYRLLDTPNLNQEDLRELQTLESAKNGYKNDFEFLLKKALFLVNEQPKRIIVLSIPDYSFTPYAHRKKIHNQSKQIDAFNEINRKIAVQYKTGYLDISTLMSDAKNDLSFIAPDGLHPSGKQYFFWAEVVAEMVQKKV